MNPENQSEIVVPKESIFTPLSRVTPVSKVLAAIIFIILPFVGAYVGYQLAPEKVVEVENDIDTAISIDKEVLKMEDEIIDKSDQLKNFTDDVFGFSFKYPTEWGEVSVEVYNGVCAKEVLTPCQRRKYYFTGPDSSNNVRFMVAMNNTFSLHAGDGGDGYWGMNAGNITNDYMDKCVSDESCKEITSNSGVKITSTYGLIYDYGEEENPTKKPDYIYQIHKDDINVGIIMSSRGLVNQPNYENLFQDTVVKTFEFLNQY